MGTVQPSARNLRVAHAVPRAEDMGAHLGLSPCGATGEDDIRVLLAEDIFVDGEVGSQPGEGQSVCSTHDWKRACLGVV